MNPQKRDGAFGWDNGIYAFQKFKEKAMEAELETEYSLVKKSLRAIVLFPCFWMIGVLFL